MKNSSNQNYDCSKMKKAYTDYKLLKMMEEISIKNNTHKNNFIDVLKNIQKPTETIDNKEITKNDDIVEFDDIYTNKEEEIKPIDNMNLTIKPKKSLYDIYKLIKK